MDILDMISSYACSDGHRIAVCSALNSDDKISYSQLEDFSDKLAFYIQNKLKNNKAPIVVYGHKSPYMIVCFLACVKSGRAYCPVDVSIPEGRLRDIIAETKTSMIFAMEDFDFKCENSVVSLDEVKDIIEITKDRLDKSYSVGDNDIFYIIFTSGSTGRPKGVQITRSCLNNFLKWAETLGGRNLGSRNDTFINQALFSFDLSVMDLYTSLYTGGTLWCLEKTIQSDYKLLLKSLKASNASVWVSTPSFVNVCLALDDFNKNLMPNMSLFLFCGETLLSRTAEALLERFPGAKVINTYGPTESTVAVTEVDINQDIIKKYNSLPVGVPKSGTYIFLVDKDENELSEGEKGEILIAGDTVGLGYFNRPDITEKAFGIKEVRGIKYRSYRTGDEGYMKDGYLFYSGRIDFQIKLHGYRIELEDIERNLLRISGVKNAVVLPINKNGITENLAAFVIPGFEVENSIKAGALLKKELSKFLPVYMIPKKFIFIDSVPMTVNGKINRKKLLERI